MQRSTYISLLMFATLVLIPSVGNVKSNHDARWSQDLSAEQHAKAKEIIKQVHPRIKELRKEVRAKIDQLEEFCFSKVEDEQTLARLGQELQQAREALRNELKSLDNRLIQEVGVSMRAYRGRSSAHLGKDVSQDTVKLHKHITSIPHHGEQ